ncbi:MAG TPA: deoxyribonuclease IV [Vicinamibacterales bacterium]|nr:deoxyribonuclease IV [Vicinamibacterales bacterium]
MSTAGGLPKAVERAVLHGCEALQIFTKSPGQWRARPLPPDEVRRFRRDAERAGLNPVVAHASYLINLAARDEPLRTRSIESLQEELDRCDALGLLGLVVHPGARTGGSDAEGLQLIARALDQVFRSRRRGKALVLLEHTAGTGTVLGHRFEHLAFVLELMKNPRRVGVWLDTCHLLAAGYDITTETGYAATFDGFDRLIGLPRLYGFHMNDSKRPLGSRIDRHEHIGKGCVGLEAFRRVLRDRRFATLPMLLETPKTEGRSGVRPQLDPLDAMNLNALRALRGR